MGGGTMVGFWDRWLCLGADSSAHHKNDISEQRLEVSKFMTRCCEILPLVIVIFLREE